MTASTVAIEMMQEALAMKLQSLQDTSCHSVYSIDSNRSLVSLIPKSVKINPNIAAFSLTGFSINCQ
jgi:hypothetical protein